MKQSALATLAAYLVGMAQAGTVAWDGRFNDMTSSADLAAWSWSNQEGAYQYYIHGSSDVTAYVNLDSTYKNPADTASTQGAKITLDSTAYWNGQTMRRTELIPQVSPASAIVTGTAYYHFSLMRSDTNAPSVNREHQIAFFESHFTEMKAGWISGAAGESDDQLRWFVGGSSQWNTTWEAGVWHNVVYEIDFDASTVGFWHSTGADALTQVVAPMAASVSSNGADFHVGVLELARDGYTDTTEDFYFSGVYVETGDLTTDVSGGGGAASSGSASTAVAATSSAAAVVVKSSSSSVASVATTSSVKAVATEAAATTPAVASSSTASSASAAVTSHASTSAAPATTAAPVSSKSTCTKKTKTVYVTM